MHAWARQRRAVLHGAAAAGLSLLVPGCGPKPEPEESASAGGSAPSRRFASGALRIDFLHAFRSGKETFTATNLRHEPAWAGPTARLSEDIGWGDYRLSVYDVRSDELLFRDGFDSSIAAESQASATRISVRCPLPYDEFRAVVEKRRTHTVFQRVWERSVIPTPREIDRTAPRVSTVVDVLTENGPSATKVDLAIVAEGYTESEYGKFTADAKRAMDYLFAVEPFRTRMGDFNVRAVFAESKQSGVTDRHFGVDRDTVLRCAYGSGGAERTLESTDVRLVNEAAAAAPADFVLVLANSRRYGGSAYFRGPAVVAIDSAFARYLVLHEIGHVIAGLAEEYYVAGPERAKYSGSLEPWYPNVTTFERVPQVAVPAERTCRGAGTVEQSGVRSVLCRVREALREAARSRCGRGHDRTAHAGGGSAPDSVAREKSAGAPRRHVRRRERLRGRHVSRRSQLHHVFIAERLLLRRVFGGDRAHDQLSYRLNMRRFRHTPCTLRLESKRG